MAEPKIAEEFEYGPCTSRRADKRRDDVQPLRSAGTLRRMDRANPLGSPMKLRGKGDRQLVGSRCHSRGSAQGAEHFEENVISEPLAKLVT